MLVLVSDSLIDTVLKKWSDFSQISLAEPFLNKHVIWCEPNSIPLSAKKLEKELLNLRGSITVMAHGRSGLVIMDALLNSDKLKEKVEKLVLIQTPVWGTPLADFLTGHAVMRTLTQVACFFMNLKIEVIEEMTEFNRQVYMILNRSQIQKLMTEKNIVTVGTTFEWKVKPETWTQKVLFKFNKLIAKHAGPNDGWVPEKATRIAKEEHLSLAQITHLGSLSTMKNSNTDDEEIMLSKLSEYPKQFLLVPSEEHIFGEPSLPLK